MTLQTWPFPIIKPAAIWTDYDRQLIELMQVAYVEGYNPRVDGIGNCIDLGRWPLGRSIGLVFRGTRNGWEPFMGDADQAVRLGPSYQLPVGQNACVCIRPPFSAAGYFALEWMRGRSLESLLLDFEFVGGYPAGIALASHALRQTFPAHTKDI